MENKNENKKTGNSCRHAQASIRQEYATPQSVRKQLCCQGVQLCQQEHATSLPFVCNYTDESIQLYGHACATMPTRLYNFVLMRSTIFQCAAVVDRGYNVVSLAILE